MAKKKATSNSKHPDAVRVLCRSDEVYSIGTGTYSVECRTRKPESISVTNTLVTIVFADGSVEEFGRGAVGVIYRPPEKEDDDEDEEK